MDRSSGKHHKRSRRRRTEPLISTRGEDGLWQSIERDEEEIAPSFEHHATICVDQKSLVTDEKGVSDQDTTQPHHQPQQPNITASSRGVLDAPSTPDTTPSKTNRPSTVHRAPTPTRADLLARVLNCPLPHPSLPTLSADLSGDTSQATQSISGNQQRGTKRQRGRPKKSRNAPNWTKPRRVRFSDPIAPGPQPEPEHRDSHVFVRLLKIIVSSGEGSHPVQRQELVWNNRAKGWRLAGERSEQNIGDIAELFDDLSEHGALLRVVLSPTEGRGAREPVEMGWNGTRCCFQGANQDGGDLSVTLGEMKDMVRDPWARQFVGYVLG